jgi:hypothetical protein
MATRKSGSSRPATRRAAGAGGRSKAGAVPEPASAQEVADAGERWT